MNKEDYVSLEVAKLLKEKGFNEDCNTFIVEECWGFNKGELRCVDKDRELCSCPTLYDAAKWLRKEYLFNIIINGIYICPENEVEECVDEQRYWKFTIYKDTNFEFEKIYTSKCCYDTYEEALNNGILKSLEII